MAKPRSLSSPRSLEDSQEHSLLGERLREAEEDREKLLQHSLALHDENNALKKIFQGATVVIKIGSDDQKRINLMPSSDLPELHCLTLGADKDSDCVNISPVPSSDRSFKSSTSSSYTAETTDQTSVSPINGLALHEGDADDKLNYCESESATADEVPRFYKKDIMAILGERNLWKENAIEVTEDLKDWQRAALETQERVAMLEAELESFRQTNPYQTEIQANALGTLPRGPKFRPHPMVEPVEVYACDMELTGLSKQEGKFVFSIQVTWTDCRRFEVYRKYGEFFTLQNNLITFFPNEAGKVNSRDRIIPSLPGRTNDFELQCQLRQKSIINLMLILAVDSVLLFFGSYNRRQMESRTTLIENYCTALLNLPKHISQSRLVIEFFSARPGDKQIESLARPTSNDLVMEVFPQAPADSTFPEYVAITTFQADSNDKRQISLSVGEVVQVIKQQTSGWWYVCRSEKSTEAGYVPATFLKKRPDDPRITEATEAEEEMLGFATSLALSLDQVDMELKYIAIDSYQSDDFRQLTFPKGAIIVVVEMTEDGWWFATYKGMGGWVPASYLEPCKPPSVEEQEKNLQFSLSFAQEGKTYVTIRSITASEGQEDELSLAKGVVVTVLEKNSSGWWKVKYRKKEGYVPAIILAPTATDIDSSLQYSVESSLGSCAPFRSGESGMTPASSTSSLVKARMNGLSRSGMLHPPPRRKYTTKQRTSTVFDLNPIVEEIEHREHNRRQVVTHTGTLSRRVRCNSGPGSRPTHRATRDHVDL